MLTEKQLNDAVKKLNERVENPDKDYIWWTLTVALDYDDEIVQVWFDPRDPYSGDILKEEQKIVGKLIGDDLLEEPYNVNSSIKSAVKNLLTMIGDEKPQAKKTEEDTIITLNGKRYKLIEED
jgi:hypothetical protein